VTAARRRRRLFRYADVVRSAVISNAEFEELAEKQRRPQDESARWLPKTAEDNKAFWAGNLAALGNRAGAQ